MRWRRFRRRSSGASPSLTLALSQRERGCAGGCKKIGLAGGAGEGGEEGGGVAEEQEGGAGGDGCDYERDASGAEHARAWAARGETTHRKGADLHRREHHRRTAGAALAEPVLRPG